MVQQPKAKTSANPDLGSIASPSSSAALSVPCPSCGGTDLTDMQVTLPDTRDFTHVSCNSCENQFWVNPQRPTSTLGWADITQEADLALKTRARDYHA